MPSSSPADAPDLDAPEERAAFLLRMRSRGIQDLAVLRAFERVPRRMFVPHRYLDLAARDLALPIGCGQTLDPPWLIARMIEALALTPQHRVLQIGAGTGYATAILAQLAREVIAVERYRGLADSAQRRLAELGTTNATVAWDDGLALRAEGEVVDRVIAHGVIADVSYVPAARLADDAIFVCARIEPAGQAIERFARMADGWRQTRIVPCRLQPIVPGLASSL